LNSGAEPKHAAKLSEPMTARPLLVLAGGYGTRLQSAISGIPKPLAPVGKKTFLQLLIERWAEQGAREFIFLLHHKADAIETFLSSWKRTGWIRDCDFRMLTEVEPLGTGGAVAHAVRHLDLSESFLVANADTWLGSGIMEVSRAAPSAMAVVRVGNADRYGSIRIEQGKVIVFNEKAQGSGSHWINAGLYHLSPELFLQWNGSPLSIEREVFPRLVNDGRLHAVPIEADFIDIGVPGDYFRFCRWIESGKNGVL